MPTARLARRHTREETAHGRASRMSAPPRSMPSPAPALLSTSIAALTITSTPRSFKLPSSARAWTRCTPPFTTTSKSPATSSAPKLARWGATASTGSSARRRFLLPAAPAILGKRARGWLRAPLRPLTLRSPTTTAHSLRNAGWNRRCDRRSFPAPSAPARR